MNHIHQAFQLSAQYLEARQAFLGRSAEELHPWLFGNDNIVGRIGEFLAMLYLQQFHGLLPETARGANPNQSKKSVDLFASGKWWSVKSISNENKRMITSPYHSHDGVPPPLIVVQFHLLEGDIRARCIAYPDGLNGMEGSSVSMKNRFGARDSNELEIERAELMGTRALPVWLQVKEFDDYWGR